VWLLELLFPSRCVACGRSADVLCERCSRGLCRLGTPCCDRCGAPTLWPVARCRECAGRRIAFTTARAAVAYAGPARPLVAAWKEHGLRRCASLAAGLVADALAPPAADVITYVPADAGRLLRRGHHPAASLAAELGRRWELPVVPLLVRSGGARVRQTELARRDRAANARGAFVAVARPRGRVVLVDDVYTTGATAASAASALTVAGARRVDVVTCARAVRG
jgi:predicted amidophosphoribosyltransferase